MLGSTPLAALPISRATGERYETGLAATAIVELLNYLPAPALVLLGLLFLAVTSVPGTALEILAVTLAGFAFLAAALGGAATAAVQSGWRGKRSGRRGQEIGAVRAEDPVATAPTAGTCLRGDIQSDGKVK